MDDRHGAKQPQRFDPARAARLDDPERFRYLPVDDVLALLDPPHGAEIVDFGTGTGTYAIAIARLRPDLHVMALDEQPQMLALLRNKLALEPQENLELMEADRVNAAQYVLAINVFHEIGDAALAQLRDALGASGRMLIVDWNGDSERPVGPPRDHVYTSHDARERLASNGFAVLHVHMFPYHYALLVARG
jgi:SAM-dependent methyltransferase